MSRVWVFTEYGDARTQQFIEQPAPEPGAGQLAVQVRAAGVNPADLKIRSGQFGRSEPTPRQLGLELAGVVTAVGSGVAGFAVGDEVLGPSAPGNGAFADETLVTVDDVVFKPENVSFDEAATIPIAGTVAYDASYQIPLEPGATVLVSGAGGGAGLLVSQLCRMRELRVIGVAGPEKQELVESTGAIHVSHTPSTDVATAIRELAPNGVDAMIDLVGGDVLRQLAGLVRDPERIILVAEPDPDNELSATPVKRSSTALETMTELMSQGAVKTHIGNRYALENADLALAAVEEGHSTGKTIIC